MSSILLTNPFLPPASPGGSPFEQATITALAPIETSTRAAHAEDAAGHSGTGHRGERAPGEAVALLRLSASMALSRPQEATGQSVVTAQGQEAPPPLPGANLPKVPMPDPLPTSPFLLQR